MSFKTLPKPARAAVALAFLIAFVSALSITAGPIVLLCATFAALVSAVGILMRRAWSAYGFAGLLALGILVRLFLAITSQSGGTLVQTFISILLYGAVAVIFLLAGLSLANSTPPTNPGTPLPWIIMALLFLAPFVFFRPTAIASTDMENTLLPGDFVLVLRSAPQPVFGQIIAFHDPSDPEQVLIRRVVALPGDRVNLASGVLILNGAPTPEAYVTHNQSRSMTFPTQVPANSYFVLGDARDISRDSRYFGFVDAKSIIGTPKFIYDSMAPDPADLKPAPPKSGNFYIIDPQHPPKRRWARVFRPFHDVKVP